MITCARDKSQPLPPLARGERGVAEIQPSGRIPGVLREAGGTRHARSAGRALHWSLARSTCIVSVALEKHFRGLQ